jgi:hypothetical protein
MAYTTINKSSEHFNTKLYTGDGSSSRNITGVGFQPDLIWFKNRDAGEYHYIFDAVRGASKAIFPNANNNESTQGTTQTAFLSDGFTVGNDTASNANGQGIASWNWKANGTGSANTDGSISSTVSANTTSGFSIVSYTGTGSAATVGHGLGAVPKMFMIKDLTSTNDWQVYHNATGNNNKLHINNTNAPTGTNNFATTTPTSSVFSISGGGQVNTSSSNYIAYCFAEKQGYSKFSSYIGNGNADGAFVYTGFKPSLIMFKSTASGTNWFMLDNKRQGFNPANETLSPNTASAASSTGLSVNTLDFLSNGFKMKTNNAEFNATGSTYIYMAIAEAPLVGTNNVPCTAR